MGQGADQARAGWLGNCSVDQHQGEDDHYYADGPGNQVEAPGVGVFAHQVAPIDWQEDEDQDYGDPDAVGYLREHEDFEEGGVGEEDDAAASYDQAGVETVERW